MDACYDIVIIGGGIHGAACAQAAAAKNYSVLVLEQYDQLAKATSSKSSKLIHGGLRYLETGQFKLVFECLRERQYLLNNAPSIVSLENFFIPIYKNTRRRPWQIFIGLMIYSLFSKKKFKIISKQYWPELDGLKTEGLQAVFQYYDGKTNDRLLTKAVMASAQSMGAELLVSAEFLYSTLINGLHEIHYQTNSMHCVKSKVIINASGPWVNDCLNKIQPVVQGVDIELVLGTHIVIDAALNKGMYYLESPQDGRAVFVMPWQGKTLIGTTEVKFTQPVSKIAAPESDINYLLELYRYYFKTDISRDDIVEVFAGCRVLPMAVGSAFKRSRDTIIHQSCESVFTIYGGKLTAHRATAENLMHCVAGYLPARKSKADTRYLALPEINHSL